MIKCPNQCKYQLNYEKWVRSFENLNLTFEIAKPLELRSQ